MARIAETTRHEGDARCIYCVADVRKSAEEFGWKDDELTLDRLPIAVFNVSAAGYEGEPVCASHIADALLEILA
jgi:hypothetical protein